MIKENLKISIYAISLFAISIADIGFSYAQTSKTNKRTSVPSTVKRQPSNRAYVTNVNRPGYGSANENTMYSKFSSCVKSRCGAEFELCYREDQSTFLNTQMNECFTLQDGISESLQSSFITKLKNEIMASCTEINGRRISGSYCIDIPMNETPEYKRYSDCMKNACAPVDGSTGNFVGCFSSKIVGAKTALENAHDSCVQMYSTASAELQTKIKEYFFNDIKERKQRACENVLKGKLTAAGECEVSVIYSRKSTFETSGIKNYVDINGEKRGTGFAEEEAEKKLETGDTLICSFDSFELTKYFFYDDSLEKTYGGKITGSDTIGPADMALITGGISLLGAIPAFLPSENKNDNYGDQLKQKQTQISNITSTISGMAPVLTGAAMLNSAESKKAMVGEFITGKCKIKDNTNSYGDTYKEGDTISIKWKSYE